MLTRYTLFTLKVKLSGLVNCIKLVPMEMMVVALFPVISGDFSDVEVTSSEPLFRWK